MSERPRRDSGRIERPADPVDVDAVGYGPDDVVQVPERYADLPVHKEQSGRADRWNDHLAEPEPSSVYVVDERYLYATDKPVGSLTPKAGWAGWRRRTTTSAATCQLSAGPASLIANGPTTAATSSRPRSTDRARRSI